jgi:hypothetical protein
VPGDFVDGASDRPRDTLAGSFRGRCRPPITPAQPRGASQFGHQGLDLPLGRFCLSNAVLALGGLELFTQLREAAPVGSLGPLV